MGSTIYSQKLKHPVFVSFLCEHCGQYNSFTQELIGTGSAEVRYGTSSKYAQSKISKIGPQAQANLDREIMKARTKTSQGRFDWLKVRKCTKCKYYQSWQKSRIWKRFILLMIWYPLFLFIYISMLTEFLSGEKTIYGWAFYIIAALVLLIPFLKLILKLTKMEKTKRSSPTVTI